MKNLHLDRQYQLSIQFKEQIDLVEKIAKILRTKFKTELGIPFYDPGSKLTLKQRITCVSKLDNIFRYILKSRSINNKLLAYANAGMNKQKNNTSENWEKVKKYVDNQINKILIKYSYSSLIDQIAHTEFEPVYTKDFRLPKPT